MTPLVSSSPPRPVPLSSLSIPSFPTADTARNRLGWEFEEFLSSFRGNPLLSFFGGRRKEIGGCLSSTREGDHVCTHTHIQKVAKGRGEKGVEQGARLSSRNNTRSTGEGKGKVRNCEKEQKIFNTASGTLKKIRF